MPTEDIHPDDSEVSMVSGTDAKIVDITPDDDPHHSRNFGLAVLYMVFVRIGWIFKTESIIMPAVLDVIGGSGLLRGCLPMLNRFGQSIPPLLASDKIRNSAIKKYRLFTTTATMGGCFFALSFVWYLTDGKKSWWLPLVFLLIYGIFFASTGINLLILNTLTGKLIRVTRRGAMSLWGTVFGAGIAVTCAWFLLRIWLVDETTLPTAENGVAAQELMTVSPKFGAIFAFTGLMFVLAATLVLFLKERPDERPAGSRTAKQLFKASWKTLKEDRNFRMVAIIAGLFGMYLTLFPHYQRLGRDRLELTLVALIPWVIAQNLGAAFFSIPSGWMADRFGNRVVLRFFMLILCVPPIMALVIAQFSDIGQGWFTVVFCLLGLTPVTMRYLNNYTLEICPNHEHPKYLSTLSLAMAAPPILLSPLFGAMVDWISFEFVFSIVILCMFVGWIMTFMIEEPRHSKS